MLDQSQFRNTKRIANGHGNGHGQRVLVQLYGANVHEGPADE
jgi:hypothetical protein